VAQVANVATGASLTWLPATTPGVICLVVPPSDRPTVAFVFETGTRSYGVAGMGTPPDILPVAADVSPTTAASMCAMTARPRLVFFSDGTSLGGARAPRHPALPISAIGVAVGVAWLTGAVNVEAECDKSK
jgi:hypothetical protein